MVRAYCGLKMVHSMALDSTASPHNRQEGAGHNRQEIKQDSTTAWQHGVGLHHTTGKKSSRTPTAVPSDCKRCRTAVPSDCKLWTAVPSDCKRCRHSQCLRCHQTASSVGRGDARPRRTRRGPQTRHGSSAMNAGRRPQTRHGSSERTAGTARRRRHVLRLRRRRGARRRGGDDVDVLAPRDADSVGCILQADEHAALGLCVAPAVIELGSRELQGADEV